MEFFSNHIGQRRFRFVVNAQNLLPHGVRPAGEKAAFRRRRPASHAENAGNIAAQAAEIRNQRVSCGVITHGRNRKDARAERSKVVGSVGGTARNNLSFAMFEDQHRRFA